MEGGHPHPPIKKTENREVNDFQIKQILKKG